MQKNSKKHRSDITPDPGGHRPQRPCAQGRTCAKQDQAQASAQGQNRTQFASGATTHGRRTRQAGKSVPTQTRPGAGGCTPLTAPQEGMLQQDPNTSASCAKGTYGPGQLQGRAGTGQHKPWQQQQTACTGMHWHAPLGGATDGAIVPARLWPLSWWVRTQKHHEAIVPARLWPFSLCPGGSGHKNITRPLPQDKATPFFRSSLTAPTWMHGFPWADLLHPCHAMPLCNIVWPHEAVNVKLL